MSFEQERLEREKAEVLDAKIQEKLGALPKGASHQELIVAIAEAVGDVYDQPEGLTYEMDEDLCDSHD